jgi:hypothetical protein
MAERAGVTLAVAGLVLTACPARPPPPPAVGPVAVTEAAIRVTGFELPESVLWDDRADVYLVSSVAGEPRVQDDNGFISRVSPDGKTVERWIDGAAPDVVLDSPRGMALAGELLYVTDLERVRLFDRTTGAPRGTWDLPAATMLNDAVTDGSDLYVSDTGLPPGVEPIGPHAVWKLALGGDKPPKPVALIRAPDLGRPNGLALRGSELWVATYGSGELFRLDAAGVPQDRETLPGGALDGLVILPDGTFYVSSWERKVVYAGRPGGPWKVAIDGVNAPADIGWDAKRDRLLVPLFEDGAIEIRAVSRTR